MARANIKAADIKSTNCRLYIKSKFPVNPFVDGLARYFSAVEFVLPEK